MVRASVLTFATLAAAMSYSGVAAQVSWKDTSSASHISSAIQNPGGEPFAAVSGPRPSIMRRKKESKPAPKKAEAPKKAAAPPPPAPVTVNKTTTNNVDQSKNNLSNLSGNKGDISNSANQVNNACSFGGHRRDLEPRSQGEIDALAAHLTRRDWAQMQQQMMQDQQAQIGAQVHTQTQAAQGAAMGMDKCKCNCAIARRDHHDGSIIYERRAQVDVAIGAPDMIGLVARLEPHCSIVQEQATGRRAYAGQCSSSTVNGRSISDVLEPAFFTM